jgi:release factor H-coupled RctB family protein
MGNFIRPLSERAYLIASDNTWIESNAIQQLQTTAQLPGMVAAAGMPDLHAGRGYPIGAAFFSIGRLYPALVGNDIGCGMSLWQTEISAVKLHLDKLEKQIGDLDDAPSADWRRQYIKADFRPTAFDQALGTIGGGNHFAELQQLDCIYDTAVTTALALDKKRLQLLIHSGSRGLGQSILRQHVERFNHSGLVEGDADTADYLAQHEQALRFAELNRELIALRILQRLRSDGRPLLDINHNLLTAAVVNDQRGWLHRKGATPADAGLVMIPGSRGDYSYLVEPILSAQAEFSLYSLAHGAGRKWMRSECKGRLSRRYSADNLSRTKFNGRVICRDKQLIFEEAPEAYKSIDSVIEAMTGAGLIRLIARFKPVLTYKTVGGNRL